MAIANVKEFFSLESRVLGLFAAIFMISLGEELWVKFIPTYFVALGGTAFMLGVFKSFGDTLDALSQLPGGIISDKMGRVRAAIMFLLIAIFGYLIFFIAPSWQYLFLGLILMQGTSSFLQPTVFSIIGDSLPPDKRTMAFSVQSILKRIPIILSPLIGGYFIARYGIIQGIHISVLFTIFFVIIGIFIIKFSAQIKHTSKNKENENIFLNKINAKDDSISHEPKNNAEGNKEVLTKEKSGFNKNLSFLLVADILARFGSAMVKYFIIIYVTFLFGAQRLGILISLQMTISILSYLPAAKIAEKIGRKPVIALTFLCFATYPYLTLQATTFTGLLFAYFIAGLREFGEPARKSLIVNLSKQQKRGQNVGLYYTIRSLSIVPAGILGGVLWSISPVLTGLVASIISGLGLLVFLVFVKDIVLS